MFAVGRPVTGGVGQSLVLADSRGASAHVSAVGVAGGVLEESTAYQENS